MKRFTDAMVFFGILGLLRLRRVAHLDAAAGQVAHDRRQQRAALRVGQHRRDAAAHRRDQRVGGAQVDADREPLLVRLGRLARLGDLQQRHQALRVRSPRRRRRSPRRSFRGT